MLMKTTRLLATGFSVALLLVVTPVLAAEDEEKFTFRVDEIVLETIQTHVDGNSAKFEEYRDLRSGFRIPSLRIFGESADGDLTFSFRGENIDRRDARYTMDIGEEGRYRLFFDYNRIQHRFGNGGNFLYSAQGGLFEIADPVQASFEEAIRTQYGISPGGVNFDFLNGLISPYQQTANLIDLGLQRNRAHGRVDVNKMGKFGFAFDVKQENRSGSRPYGGSFGFSNVIEIYEPIDYQTTDTEISGAWNSRQGGLRAGLRHSEFRNDNSTLQWDNPWFGSDSTDGRAYLSPGAASVNGPSRGLADLAPDNQSDALFIDGRYKSDEGGWRVSGSATVSSMTQDDPLLQYTLNSAIVGLVPGTGEEFDPTNVGNLPVGRADTEVRTSSFFGNASKELGENFELSLRYRYYDYDNRSARVEFPGYVRFDAVWEEIPRLSVPYGYSRDDLGLELDWDVGANSALTFSYHVKSWEREFREVDKSDEDVFGVTFDTRPSDAVSVRAGWEKGMRTISDYRVEAQLDSFVDADTVDQNPDLRKFDQAARDFDNYNVQVMLYPSPSWSVVLGVSSYDEKYDESVLGLISDETLRYNGEVSYEASERFTFFVFGDLAQRTNVMRSRQSGSTPSMNPLDDWQITFDEDNSTWGLGLTVESSERLHWDLSGNWSESDGLADFFSPPGGLSTEDIANYEDIELLALHLKVTFDVTERAEIGLTYLYEDYMIDSFNLVGLQPYLPSTILLAANNGDYQADVVGVHLKLGF